MFSQAQILDDSTKLIYGFHSTKFYTEEYFFEDSIILETIDSTFINQHEYEYYFRNRNFYQNLGNTITPVLPLSFNPYNNVLDNLAPDRFSLYRFNKKRYFNTKSPHTFLKYTQEGINDEQIFEGMYTQNITKGWNIGSEFYRGVSTKRYATSQGKDRLSSIWSVRAFSSYLSENKKYHILFDLETQNSKINEQFGVVFNGLSDLEIDETIDRAEFAEDNWNSGKNEQRYRSISLKHRYDIVKGYSGVYSKHKFTRDKRFYIDEQTEVEFQTKLDTNTDNNGDTIISTDTLSYEPIFYKDVFYSTDSTYDEKLFDAFENEVGIYLKSDLWHVKFGYLQQLYGYENNYQSTKIYGINNALKGEFNYRFIDKFNVKFATINSASGAFNTLAEIGTKYGSVSYNKILSKPFLQDDYINSNHLKWDNDFKFINTDEYKLVLKYNYKNKIALFTENRYLNINNQIFYDTVYQPQQSAKTINLIQSKNWVKLTSGKWNLEQSVLFTSKNADYMQLPQYATQTRAYWLGVLGDGVINSQIGVDFNWRSNYLANSYSPLIQNFYVQKDIRNFGYPLFDVFANFNIKTVNLFLKAGHVNQAFGRPGYLVSAYYPAKRFYFTFGVNWRFFD